MRCKTEKHDGQQSRTELPSRSLDIKSESTGKRANEKADINKGGIGNGREVQRKKEVSCTRPGPL